MDAYHDIQRLVRQQVETGRIDPSASREQVRQHISEVVHDYQHRQHLADGGTPLRDPETMIDRVLKGVVDYGSLTHLLDRDDVWEIQIQGDRVSYWTIDDDRPHRLVTPETEEDFQRYIERLLQSAATDEQVNTSDPTTSVGFPDGTRLSVKVPPVSELTVAIRKPTLRKPSLDDLVANGTVTAAAAGFMAAMMAAKLRIVVAGPPKAGKSTVMNALTAAIPGDQVVRINQDAPEINVDLEHGGYAHASTTPGQTLRDLIKLDLRFSPDWLIVDEVRGDEAYELLKPLNSGVGVLTGVHTSGVGRAIEGLATMASHATNTKEDHELRGDFARDVHAVIYCDLPPKGEKQRQITDIHLVPSELVNGQVTTEPVFQRAGPGLPLEWTGVAPPESDTDLIERALAYYYDDETIDLRQVLAGERLLVNNGSGRQ